MEQHGIRMELTGGETADVGDLVRTVIVDSTVCARIRRDHVIDNARIHRAMSLWDWLPTDKPRTKTPTTAA